MACYDGGGDGGAAATGGVGCARPSAISRRLVKNASSARSLLSGFASRGVTHGYLYERGGSQSE